MLLCMPWRQRFLPLRSSTTTGALRRRHQFSWGQPEPLNSCGNPGPFFRQKFLAFALEQQIARAGVDEHAETSLRLDQLLVDQFLISLQDRERIDPIFGRDIAHGRQRIAFFEYAVENHGDDTIAKLAINRLTVVPFMHPLFHWPSYSAILNYNTSSHAISLSIFSLPPFRLPFSSLKINGESQIVQEFVQE